MIKPRPVKSCPAGLFSDRSRAVGRLGPPLLLHPLGCRPMQHLHHRQLRHSPPHHHQLLPAPLPPSPPGPQTQTSPRPPHHHLQLPPPPPEVPGVHYPGGDIRDQIIRTELKTNQQGCNGVSLNSSSCVCSDYGQLVSSEL